MKSIFALALLLFTANFQASPAQADVATGARARAQAAEASLNQINPGVELSKFLRDFGNQFQEDRVIEGADSIERSIGDGAMAFLEIYYGMKNFFVTFNQETQVGSYKMKLLQSSFGAILLVDGIARAVITNMDRDPTISPLITYALAKAGVIEPPSHYQAVEGKEFVRQPDGMAAALGGIFGAAEVLQGVAVGFVTFMNFLDNEGRIGLTKLPGIRRSVRFASALIFMDGILRVMDSERVDASLIPLLKFGETKIRDQFNYKNGGRSYNKTR